jgi:hypothetical protein
LQQKKDKNMVISKEQTLEKGLNLCKTDYQRKILTGTALLSGADLSIKAKRYWSRYQESRNTIMAKCQIAGLNITEGITKHNKRIVVIGKTIL